jgi:hypothetical protein
MNLFGKFLLVLFRVFDRDHDGRLDRSDIVHMSSCLIDVAQFVYIFTVHMNDSPDLYAENILEGNEVKEFRCIGVFFLLLEFYRIMKNILNKKIL